MAGGLHKDMLESWSRMLVGCARQSVGRKTNYAANRQHLRCLGDGLVGGWVATMVPRKIGIKYFTLAFFVAHHIHLS